MIPEAADFCAYRALTALLARVKSVQKDVDKLSSGNETLQMYIDNLTVQMAKRRWIYVLFALDGMRFSQGRCIAGIAHIKPAFWRQRRRVRVGKWPVYCSVYPIGMWCRCKCSILSYNQSGGYRTDIWKNNKIQKANHHRAISMAPSRQPLQHNVSRVDRAVSISIRVKEYKERRTGCVGFSWNTVDHCWMPRDRG